MHDHVAEGSGMAPPFRTDPQTMCSDLCVFIESFPEGLGLVLGCEETFVLYENMLLQVIVFILLKI